MFSTSHASFLGCLLGVPIGSFLVLPSQHSPRLRWNCPGRLGATRVGHNKVRRHNNPVVGPLSVVAAVAVAVSLIIILAVSAVVVLLIFSALTYGSTTKRAKVKAHKMLEEKLLRLLRRDISILESEEVVWELLKDTSST